MAARKSLRRHPQRPGLYAALFAVAALALAAGVFGTLSIAGVL